MCSNYDDGEILDDAEALEHVSGFFGVNDVESDNHGSSGGDRGTRGF